MECNIVKKQKKSVAFNDIIEKHIFEKYPEECYQRRLMMEILDNYIMDMEMEAKMKELETEIEIEKKKFAGLFLEFGTRFDIEKTEYEKCIMNIKNKEAELYSLFAKKNAALLLNNLDIFSLDDNAGKELIYLQHNKELQEYREEY